MAALILPLISNEKSVGLSEVISAPAANSGRIRASRKLSSASGLLSHLGICASECLTPPRHAISISWRTSETTAEARFGPDSPIQVTPEVTPQNGTERSKVNQFYACQKKTNYLESRFWITSGLPTNRELLHSWHKGVSG